MKGEYFKFPLDGKEYERISGWANTARLLRLPAEFGWKNIEMDYTVQKYRNDRKKKTFFLVMFEDEGNDDQEREIDEDIIIIRNEEED